MRDDEGHTASEAAAQRGHVAVAAMIESHLQHHNHCVSQTPQPIVAQSSKMADVAASQSTAVTSTDGDIHHPLPASVPSSSLDVTRSSPTVLSSAKPLGSGVPLASAASASAVDKARRRAALLAEDEAASALEEHRDALRWVPGWMDQPSVSP